MVTRSSAVPIARSAACERVSSQPTKDLRIYLTRAWWGTVSVMKGVSMFARVLRIVALALEGFDPDAERAPDTEKGS